jgi:hypothetical protein
MLVSAEQLPVDYANAGYGWEEASVYETEDDKESIEEILPKGTPILFVD